MSGMLRKSRSSNARLTAAPPFLKRQDSASLGKWSNDVVAVVESGTVDEIRIKMAEGLMNSPDSLLSQNMRNEHGLRTPLMAAAATGDFALFTAVMHAVDRAIDQTAGRKFTAAELKTRQLSIKDSRGMTLVMIAAEGGMVPIIRAVLLRITSTKDYDRLIDSDYRGNTLLMHAAAAGRSVTFDAFLEAVQGGFPEKEVEEQLRARSGNGWNILMHAARCGDQLGVTAVINACKANMFPSKMRDLVEETDGDGMTLLMHAASGSRARPINAGSAAFRQRREEAAQQTSTTDPSASGLARARGAPPIGRFEGIAEEDDDDIESGGPDSPSGDRARSSSIDRSRVNSCDNSPVHDDGTGGLSARFGMSTDQSAFASASMMEDGDDASDDSVDSRRRNNKGTRDPSLVVFKTAWAMVEELLWKEKIRDQLKATDTWGRNILIHAVQSGRVQVFEAAFNAMRDHILDPETDKLLDVDYEDNTQSLMETALESAPREMVSLVARRDQELKKAIAEAETASTIEAKMQSFIPGKLIVIFQLLLPETGDSGSGALFLLLVLTAVAPFLTWATILVGRDKPAAVRDARHSKMTNLLSAPAIFFWGVGTSEIGSDSLGWTKTSSAAALAVATIVIPGVDAFCANQRVEQWFDKWSCQSWRFNKKADFYWLREKKKLHERMEHRERHHFTHGANQASKTKWSCCGLCNSQDMTVVTPTATRPPSQPLHDVGDGPPTGAAVGEERMPVAGEKQGLDSWTLVVPHAASTPALSQTSLGDMNFSSAGAAEEKEAVPAAGEKQETDL